MTPIARQLLAAAGVWMLAAAPAASQTDASSAQSTLAATLAAPDGETVALQGEEARAAIARASDWLNSLTAAQGRFQQMNPDGRLVAGDVFIQRPGRMRFAYDAPTPLTIVADGRTVAVVDTELETVDRTLLEEMPLSWLLRANVDLSRDARIGGVARQEGMTLISIQDSGDRIAGQLVLMFSGPDSALREWVTVEANGQQTRVILSDLERVERLDPALFTYDGPRGTRRPGGR